MEKDPKQHNELDILVRPSSFFLFFNLICVHLILLGGIVLVLLVPGLFFRAATDVEIILKFQIVAILLLVLVGEIFTILLLARWVTEFYVIKNDSLTYRMGIFFKQKRVLLIRQIVEVLLHQHFFGHVFNYGTIKVITPQSWEGILIRRVENPNKYFKVLRELSIKQQALVQQEQGKKKPIGPLSSDE